MKAFVCLCLLPTVAMADSLASEKIKGNVLVRAGTALHATAAAARADSAATKGLPIAMRVVRDHGDVVELSTAATPDCARSFDQPYVLTVFVKRGMLYPRTKVEVVKTFADGTAVAIDRGAAVEGGAWVAPVIAETKVSPIADQLAYGVPANIKPAALPPLTGERLICDRGAPMTKQEWIAQRDRERAIEEERASRERAKKQANKPKMDQDKLENFDARDLGAARAGAMLEEFAPHCGVVDTARHAVGSSPPATKPKIDGVAVSFPTYASPIANDHVVKQGTQYLGDVAYRCGRTRVLVERDGVSAAPGGASIDGGGTITLWVPKPGKVTWLDGRPAGTYKGGKRYANVVEKGDRICVQVNGVAERVCHPKITTKTMQGSRFGAD